ncbi:nuclear transport factor 2 family protein [Blastomonas sp.]|uniref:nuclear transport factor 2 family protein n=1 Tax=Blastomonas sp. TaxID=1909299 RepID=UPI0026196A0F|nr:nuclear transport factor 2 family protein [Blastomonas sp.]MDM7955103.1 nuclear transport factor 2 family protein [Blastomonas sp.]
MTDHIATLKRVIESWHRSDVEGVLACLHEDVIWNNSGGIRAPIMGREAMRAALESMKGRITNNRWRLFDFAQAGDTVWMEGVDEFDSTDGIRVAIPYCGILEYEDGVIRHWREYFDGRLQEDQLAGKGVSPHVDAMLDRPTV